MFMSEEAASQYQCCICFGPFRNPVLTECDHIFCGQCLQVWLHNGQNTCVVCRRHIVAQRLRPVPRPIMNILKTVNVTCGCSAVTKLTKMEEHEKICNLVLRKETWNCEECNARLNASVSKYHNCVEHLEMEIQSRRTRYNAKLNTLHRKLEDREAESEVLSISMNRATKLLDESSKRNAKLESELPQLKNIISMREKELNQLYVYVRDTKTEVEVLSRANGRKLKDMERKEKLNAKLEADIRELKRVASMKEKETKTLRKNVYDLVIKMKFFMKESRSKSEEMKIMEKQISALETELEITKRVVSVKEKELNESMKKVKETKSQLEELTKTVNCEQEELKKEVSKQAVELQSLNEGLSGKDGELFSLRGELAEQKSRNESLVFVFEEKNREMETLKKEITEMKEVVSIKAKGLSLKNEKIERNLSFRLFLMELFIIGFIQLIWC